MLTTRPAHLHFLNHNDQRRMKENMQVWNNQSHKIMSTAEFSNMVVITAASNVCVCVCVCVCEREREGCVCVCVCLCKEQNQIIMCLFHFSTTHTMHKFHVSHKLVNRFTHKTWQIWSKKFPMDTFTEYKHVLWTHDLKLYNFVSSLRQSKHHGSHSLYLVTQVWLN